MRPFALLPLLAFALSAQAPFHVLAGTATAVSRDRITVHDESTKSVLLFADKDSKIWRGKTTNILSDVHPGDDVTVKYREDSSGRSVILDLWANKDRFMGLITRVTPTEFEVEENFGADPQSGYRRGPRSIVFDSATEFEESAPEDLRAGRTVDIMGLKVDDSRVVASRITVYEGNARKK